MALTPKQLENRKNFVGSSDMAAILGQDPYRSAYDVWMEKTNRVEHFAGNAATDRGNLLEPVLLQWAERELETPIALNVFAPGPFPLAANLDGDCEELDAIIEAKTSIVRVNRADDSTMSPDEWGEEGTDEVPLRHIIQTHVAMICRGRQQAFLPLMVPAFGRFDLRMYCVQRNADLCAAIIEKAEYFWTNHVLADLPPEGSIGSLEILKRVRRVPEKTVSLRDEVVDRYLALTAARLQAEKDEKIAKAEVLTALGDAEAGEYSGGTLTYFQTARKGYTVEPTTCRTLRNKPAKAKGSRRALAASGVAPDQATRLREMMNEV